MKTPDFIRYILRGDWRLVKRSIRFWWQRRTRGWDDGDTWSLDNTIAKFVLPRLKRFKELNNGFPGEFTSGEWDKVLDDMIYALTISANGHWNAPDDADWKRVQRGHELFGKYFNDLWW